MVLSINIPEDVKSIFNSMKQLNKNRILFDLGSKINQIYHSELNIIYGNEIYSQNYTSLEDMLCAMHIIKNDGNLLQVFLDENAFEIPAINMSNYNFENNLFLGTSFMSAIISDVLFFDLSISRTKSLSIFFVEIFSYSSSLRRICSIFLYSFIFYLS